MNRIILSAILFSTYSLCYSQNAIDLFKNLEERNKPNNSANGHYELVGTINKTQINKGDSALVDIYITGYGKISQAKIFILCSSSEILKNDVYITHSFASSNNNLLWGVLGNSFIEFPIVMELSGGITKTQQNTRTLKDTSVFRGMFLDANENPKSTDILTEHLLKLPPAQIHLRFKKHIKADDYKLYLYMTYFNGEQWSGSSVSIDFRIKSFIQRHEWLIVLIATLAAIVGLLPGIQIAKRLFKRVINNRKKISPPKTKPAPTPVKKK